MIRFIAVTWMAFALMSPVMAEPKAPVDEPTPVPSPAPAPEKPKYHLSKPIVKDVNELEHFISGETETTFETMGDAMGKIFFPLMELLGKDGVIFDYPAIFIYKGVTSNDPKTKFTLQIGYPARPECKEPKGFKIGKLPGHRCVSAYFTGPLSEMEAAYKAIFAQVFKDGHQPTGQTRELYLYWDGEASPNTVVEIQVSIAKPVEDRDAKKE